MSKGRLAIVNSPQFAYCSVYHCAGDCGLPHNQNERLAYVAHALATFDALTADKRRTTVDAVQATRRKARNAL